jgi:hypothetical protein
MVIIMLNSPSDSRAKLKSIWIGLSRRRAQGYWHWFDALCLWVEIYQRGCSDFVFLDQVCLCSLQITWNGIVSWLLCWCKFNEANEIKTEWSVKICIGLWDGNLSNLCTRRKLNLSNGSISKHAHRKRTDELGCII